MFEESTLYIGVSAIIGTLYLLFTAKKRREKYIRAYSFPESLKNSFPSKITEGGREEILKALKVYFVILNQANNAKFFVPSKILLETWRAFVKLDEYEYFSEKAFGHKLLPPQKTRKINKKSLRNAFKTVWSLARKEEKITDTENKKLPLIFKLDKMLNIEKGTVYHFKKNKQRSKRKNKKKKYNFLDDASFSITYDSDDYMEYHFELAGMSFTVSGEEDMSEYNDNISSDSNSSSSSSSNSHSSSDNDSSSDSGGGD